ncbi:G-D-S-L family lipolytic protein [Aquimarina gracilis]|uniref:G-D-S-L family lipolytic protein n=1 Tax=Aquimarina gracilis TaxID=874422 RepID=A0ABU5ZPP4_9FLAO|nr:G-D-S-L family lipolytic protein [Aquimarina gracilis]MEB3344081.1 G-D-S-L family lipolytic protein [Aquimarina gracilis]
MMIKNNIKYLAVLALGLVACEPEFDNPIEDAGTFTNGEADFSNYVALGNSLTAGFADGALYITGQENSFPNILSQQFAKAGGGDFTQPLMSDNVGGFAEDNTNFPPRFVLAFDADGNPGPAPYTGAPSSTSIAANLGGAFNNMGVPGARVYHLDFAGYATLNPYYGRFAQSPTATVVDEAVAQNPTFFSLWIGNNDILGYATSGGVGEDHNETGNLDPSTYSVAGLDITNNNVFAAAYSGLVAKLVANNAKGVLLNLPDVTSLPFFTTVPNNALVLDATTAASLTGFFQAVAGIVTAQIAGTGVPLDQAQAIASQYAITFNEGPNRFLLKTEVTQTNPLGFRQMTEAELLLLTIDSAALAQGYGSVVLTDEVLQVLGILQMGGMPTPEQGAMVIAAINAIDDKDVLDVDELSAISSARSFYNTTISSLASANGLAFYNVASDLSQAANGGIPFDGGVVTSDFVTGGGFSLDGVHPTPRAHALVTNGILDAIEITYGANLPRVNLADYGTVTLSNEVN